MHYVFNPKISELIYKYCINNANLISFSGAKQIKERMKKQKRNENERKMRNKWKHNRGIIYLLYWVLVLLIYCVQYPHTPESSVSKSTSWASIDKSCPIISILNTLCAFQKCSQMPKIDTKSAKLKKYTKRKKTTIP